MPERADLVVVGAGRSGLEAARHAALIGAQVTLVERTAPGGRGLEHEAASLAIAAAGRAARQVRAARSVGFDAHEPSFRYVRLAERVRAAIDRARAEAVAAAGAPGIELVTGEARFTAPLALAVGTRALDPRRVLLATGRVSSPVPEWCTPPASLAAATALPPSVAVVVTSAEHLALAQGLARLGSRVTVLAERWPFSGPDALPGELKALLEREAVAVLEPARVESARAEGREWILSVRAPEGPLEVRVAVVVALPPSVPDVAALLPAEGGVEIGPAGIHTDDRFRTSAASVLAVGSATRPAPSPALALKLARAAVDAALGASRASAPGEPAGYEMVPTDPEVARAGHPEREASERRPGEVLSVTVPLRTSPLHPAPPEGCFVRLVGDRDGKLLGLEAMAPDATTLAEIAALALRDGNGTDELAGLSGTASLDALAAAAAGLRSQRRVSVWKRLTGRHEGR